MNTSEQTYEKPSLISEVPAHVQQGLVETLRTQSLIEDYHSEERTRHAQLAASEIDATKPEGMPSTLPDYETGQPRPVELTASTVRAHRF